MFYSDYKTILSTVNSFTKTSLNIEIVSSDEGKHMNPTQEKQNDFIFFLRGWSVLPLPCLQMSPVRQLLLDLYQKGWIHSHSVDKAVTGL